MPYAVRNAEGQLVSLHRHDPGIGDFVAGDHPDVRLFLGLSQVVADTGSDPDPDPEVEAGFTQLDADFIRVLEDVVDALTSRNLLNITDLPEVAQSKLYARKSFRERRNQNALDLFNPADLEALI
jgi:hypothetical protein